MHIFLTTLLTQGEGMWYMGVKSQLPFVTAVITTNNNCCT